MRENANGPSMRTRTCAMKIAAMHGARPSRHEVVKCDAPSARPTNLSSDGPVRRFAQPIPIEQAQEMDAIDAGRVGRCRDVSAVAAEHRNEVIALESLDEARLGGLEGDVEGNL